MSVKPKKVSKSDRARWERAHARAWNAQRQDEAVREYEAILAEPDAIKAPPGDA